MTTLNEIKKQLEDLLNSGNSIDDAENTIYDQYIINNSIAATICDAIKTAVDAARATTTNITVNLNLAAPTPIVHVPVELVELVELAPVEISTAVNTAKAPKSKLEVVEVATITLGNTPLEVHRDSKGNYTMSLVQIAEAMDLDNKRLSQLRELNDTQTLVPQGFRDVVKVKVLGGTKPVSAVSLMDVTSYFLLAASRGNIKALALLGASLAEALERRADKEYEVIRTEEERNERVAVRMASICATKDLMDKVEESPLFYEYAFSQVNEAVNKYLGIPKGERPKAGTATQLQIRDLNRETMRNIKNTSMSLVSCVHEAAKELGLADYRKGSKKAA